MTPSPLPSVRNLKRCFYVTIVNSTCQNSDKQHRLPHNVFWYNPYLLQKAIFICKNRWLLICRFFQPSKRAAFLSCLEEAREEPIGRFLLRASWEAAQLLPAERKSLGSQKSTLASWSELSGSFMWMRATCNEKGNYTTLVRLKNPRKKSDQIHNTQRVATPPPHRRPRRWVPIGRLLRLLSGRLYHSMSQQYTIIRRNNTP